jgi:hypothetical protein
MDENRLALVSADAPAIVRQVAHLNLDRFSR